MFLLNSHIKIIIVPEHDIWTLDNSFFGVEKFFEIVIVWILVFIFRCQCIFWAIYQRKLQKIVQNENIYSRKKIFFSELMFLSEFFLIVLFFCTSPCEYFQEICIKLRWTVEHNGIMNILATNRHNTSPSHCRHFFYEKLTFQLNQSIFYCSHSISLSDHLQIYLIHQKYHKAKPCCVRKLLNIKNELNLEITQNKSPVLFIFILVFFCIKKKRWKHTCSAFFSGDM